MIKHILLIISLLLSVLTGCGVKEDRVLSALSKPVSQQTYSHGAFQDYTDFGISQYQNITAEQLEAINNFDHIADVENRSFTAIDDGNIDTVRYYVEDFEKWVSLAVHCQDCELANGYCFSTDSVNTGDYFCLQIKNPEWPTSNYTLYYFSLDEQTLYYFHNNI